MTWRPAAALAALLLASSALLSVSGCGGKCGPKKGVVSEVVDGDTFHLESGETIRLLMVNTPEISGTPPDCFGDEARRFAIDMIEGQEVHLEYDKEECTDRFDRLLAFVTVDGRELNSLLVERGYACTFYIPPSGEDRLEEFEALELDARAEGRGLWGSCTEITCQD